MIARLVKREILARDTALFEFRLRDQVDLYPGQSFKLVLPNPKYPDIQGPGRFFSVASIPEKQNIISTIMRLRKSGFKRSLAEAPLGIPVDISNIGGVFLLPAVLREPLVFIAGGVGITPFLSMLEFIKNHEPSITVTLFNSNQTQDLAIKLSELKALEKEMINFRQINTFTRDNTWAGESRRVDINFIKDYLPELEGRKYYISGSPRMTTAIYQNLVDAGVLSRNIFSEEFTGY